MRLYMAYSQWKNLHGVSSDLMLDWTDFEKMAREQFEGKTAELEEALDGIDPDDRDWTMETYEELYDMALGNSNRLDNDYEAKKLFDEMSKQSNQYGEYEF